MKFKYIISYINHNLYTTNKVILLILLNIEDNIHDVTEEVIPLETTCDNNNGITMDKVPIKSYLIYPNHWNTIKR